MIPDNLLKIMEKDGVVAIVTSGPDGPHMVNTWNSYLKVSQDGRLFIPAGYVHKTEANIAHSFLPVWQDRLIRCRLDETLHPATRAPASIGPPRANSLLGNAP